MKIQLLLCTAIILLSCPLQAQQLNHLPGEFLVSVSSDEDFLKNIDGFNQRFREEEQLFIHGKVSETMDIWHLSVDPVRANEYSMLELLKEQNWIVEAQFNHLIQNRARIPNDPFFDDMWHFLNNGDRGGLSDADIDADEAWEISTGGTTIDGKEIVVAVIDDGIALDHVDLLQNIWINPDEIADNGIDDDNNGYVDDVHGWNTIFNSNRVDTAAGSIAHGVYVSGMVGARGNNNTGVAGINWSIKIMTVVGGDGTEANALQSYDYVLQQRRRYNQTAGAEGAFVVSANSSWGIDLSPDDAPLWCAFYDNMGQEGIVNVGATKNISVDIDQVSDLPTACPSDYLITVTASDRRDLRNFAAYGLQTIDLAAPGQDVYTTGLNGNYKEETGTSFASPLVAGAVALLYATPCYSFQSIVESDPGAAALLAKQFILDGVDQLPQFEDELVSGGRLNMHKSMQLLLTQCLSCPYPTSVQQSSADEDGFTIEWVVPDSIVVNLRVRNSVNMEWDTFTDVSSPFEITADNCGEYEIQFQSLCPGDTTEYGNSLFVEIGAARNIDFTVNVDNTLSVSWEGVPGADSYRLRYRIPGDQDWTVLSNLSQTFASLGELMLCTTYEVQVRANCSQGTSMFSESVFFISEECPDCDTLNYCAVPDSIDARFEWIDSFYLAGFANGSGNDDGYGNYTGEPFAFLDLMMAHDFRLVQEYDFNTFDEYFKIYIDLNIDGDFEDDGELVFDAGGGSDQAVEGEIFIPSDATTGNTRLRVVMKFVSSLDTAQPQACPNFEFGEVEDYCVVINGCGIPRNLERIGGGMGEAQLEWEEIAAALAYNVRYRPVGSMDWMEMSTLENDILLANLDCGLDVEVQVRSVCPLDTSAYTSSTLFDPCPDAIDDPEEEELSGLRVYPNPFDQQLQLEWLHRDEGPVRLSLYDMNGRLQWSREWGSLTAGEQSITLDGLESLASGLYILHMQSGRSVRTVKVVKTGM